MPKVNYEGLLSTHVTAFLNAVPADAVLSKELRLAATEAMHKLQKINYDRIRVESLARFVLPVADRLSHCGRRLISAQLCIGVLESAVKAERFDAGSAGIIADDLLVIAKEAGFRSIGLKVTPENQNKWRVVGQKALKIRQILLPSAGSSVDLAEERLPEA